MPELVAVNPLGAEAAHNTVAGVYKCHPAPVGLGSGKVSYEFAVHVCSLGLLAVVAHEGDNSICCCFPDWCNATAHIPQGHGQEVLIDLHDATRLRIHSGGQHCSLQWSSECEAGVMPPAWQCYCRILAVGTESAKAVSDTARALVGD